MVITYGFIGVHPTSSVSTSRLSGLVGTQFHVYDREIRGLLSTTAEMKFVSYVWEDEPSRGGDTLRILPPYRSINTVSPPDPI